MSAPFFLGRVIDVIYTDPAADFGGDLARLCVPLSGLFLCGAAANAVRVYLMQTSGKSLAGGGHPGPLLPAPRPCGQGPRARRHVASGLRSSTLLQLPLHTAGVSVGTGPEC